MNIQGNGLTIAVTGPFPGSGVPTPDGGVPMADAGPMGADASTGTDAGMTDDGCGCATPGAPTSNAGGLAVAGLVAGIAARRMGADDDPDE